MDKAELMALGTVIKFLIGLGGIILSLVFLAVGLIKKDNTRLKRAGLVFVGIWLILLVFGAVEFLILVKL